MAATLHPAVAQMPPDAESSIASVAHYLRDREHDPRLLAKALHDWVADRVAYDGESYVKRQYPPQDAETVFRTRKSVCAGYSTLLVALGREAGVQYSYVIGDARTKGVELSGEGHAWNAVKLGEQWYLVDATWDAGYLDGATFKKRYRTEYFMTPPNVFGVDHFPQEADWQLRKPALSRGEFLRQPMMNPAFYAYGLELAQPSRSQVTTRGALDVEVGNTQKLFFLYESQPKMRCRDAGRDRWTLHCDIADPGKHTLQLFASRAQYGEYDYVGQIEVQNTP